MMQRWIEDVAIRAIDIAVALVALVTLSPFILLITIAILLHDGRPAIFRQERVGRGSRLFTIYKFRTMRVVAPQARPPVSGSPEQTSVSTAPLHRTQKGDLRITPVGRFLRPSHLDELPQILNVLAGDMSLVGVRPDTPMQRGDYSPEYWHDRHRFRPGITGPAQVANGELTLEQRSDLERVWLDGRTFGTYVGTLWRTLGKVRSRSSN